MPPHRTGSNHVAMLNLTNVYSWEALTDPNHAIAVSVHLVFFSVTPFLLSQFLMC